MENIIASLNPLLQAHLLGLVAFLFLLLNNVVGLIAADLILFPEKPPSISLLNRLRQDTRIYLVQINANAGNENKKCSRDLPYTGEIFANENCRASEQKGL